MRKFSLLAFLLIILASFSLSDFFYKNKYVYDNQVGKQEFESSVLVKKIKNNYVLDKLSRDGIAKLIYDKDYKLNKYMYKMAKKNTRLSLTLEKSKLIAHRQLRGRTHTKALHLNTNWVQDFNFGFYNFLASSNAQYNFVIFNIFDFDTYDMVAYKEDIQEIKIKDKVYKAQKLKVTLKGFQSMFWKAEIWYDAITHVLLKYQANEGPGTKIHTITLNSIDVKK